MFRNIRNFAINQFKSVHTNSYNYKLANSTTRTFSSSTNNGNTSFSPLTKILLTGGLLVGTGYVLHKTSNKSSEEEHPLVMEYQKKVYGYTAFNLALTAISAIGVYKSGLAQKIINMNSYTYLLLFAGGTCTAMLTTMVSDIDKNNILKHSSLVTFNVLSGLSLGIIGLMYRPELIFRAILYTAGTFATLSFVAMNSKQDKYLWLGGPLLAGLTLVCMSSFARVLFPFAISKTLCVADAITLYGGLLVFCLYVLYDTQRMKKNGEIYKEFIENKDSIIKKPDHINESLGIYLTITNLLLTILDLINNKKI